VTPEQTTELLKALNQHNWFLVGCGVVWLLGTVLQFFVVTRIKSVIENKQHFNRVRYEREMKVFEEIWPKLCELQEAVLDLRPVMDCSPQEGETIESRKLKRAEKFTIAFTDFRTAIKHNRPFYPPIIWDELGKVLQLCWGEATEFSVYANERKPRDYWGKAMDNAKAINEQIDKTCEAIRTRLSKFDSN